ncbi:uncharacterized protein LOC129589726 [Paramacrobiotus metropolitanus]|uniref:uncharacterized protein LOC129589726 n=1 Tax=Paramacrobiotus metropolitanus TaxID=2943436 RepID=UPI002445CCD8|nr:uncharacterized protein LOC129589726 [Paramacrobiotus metropolitanus]
MRVFVCLLSVVAVCHAGVYKRAAGDQNPKVYSALDVLSNGKTKLDAGQRAELYKAAQAGQDYPTLAVIPKAGVDCASVKPGFYANDGEGKCQAFDRCDVNGNLTSYLCPNMTLFNQITLICDWFFNVDCTKVRQFYDYSNSRLYQENSPLLDDEPDYVVVATGAAESSSSASASGSVTIKKTVSVKGKPKREFDEHQIEKRAAGQSPKVFSALDDLSGGKTKLDAGQRQDIYKNAQAGQDFPTLSAIPAAGVDCGSVKPGFYANDGAGKCQSFDRCDVNGNLTSYLCPNMTLFNQITLICDWFFNVDCSKARQYYDYSNSRLYQENSVLLDDEPDYVQIATGASSSSASASGSVTIKKTVSVKGKPKREFDEHEEHHDIEKRAAGDQNPKVFSALDALSNGKTKLDAGQRAELYKAAQAGQDYPTLSVIPKAGVDCASVKPGFYANDGEGKCQAFDRCDVNGNLTSYLCPNMTLFNQITLICDWFFNVDCTKVRQFYDYSNSRLYVEGSPLLDDEPDYVQIATGAAESSASGSASASGSVTIKKTVVKKGGKKA